MAKKTVKKSKAKVKAKSTVSKTAAPGKSGSNYMRIVIISSVIFAAALVFGIVYSQVRSAQLEKAAAAPAVVSQVSPASIQIQDPATKKSYTMDIKPASVSQSPAQAVSQTAAAPQAAPPAPVESPTSTNIPARCKVYFKAIDVKANIHRMDIEDAWYLYNSGKALFIDARGPNEFADAHVKGSINIPVNTTPVELEKLKDKLQGKLLVTYCHGVGCHLSDKTAYLLFDAGYRKVGIFFGGWPKWNEHKYPIDAKVQPAATQVPTK
jgi:rhodanese-related sulfurtransferase